MGWFRKINTEKYVGGRGATTGVVRSEKRRGGRIKCSALLCEFGQIQDLSSTGLRTHSKKKPTVTVGETRSITIKSPDENLSMRGRCVWIRVDEACEFDMGWEFLHIDALTKKRLLEMAATGQATEGLSRGWAPMQWWNSAG